MKPITRDWLLQTLSRLVVSTQVRRVLIIEDDEGSRAALQTLLKPLCREILVAATAAEAMALLRGSVPDLAIVDVRLPDMNGLDLIDVVRGEPLHDALSLIVCTSLELSAEERRRLEQHGARLLPKSALTPEDLLQAVLCALAHTRAARLMRPDLQTPRLAG